MKQLDISVLYFLWIQSETKISIQNNCRPVPDNSITAISFELLYANIIDGKSN